jgi:hypothetical protein
LRIDPKKTVPRAHRVVTIVLVSGIHRVVNTTVSFAKSLDTDVIAVYVGADRGKLNKCIGSGEV